MIIKLGAYSCEVLDNATYAQSANLYIVTGFKMSDRYGLNVEARIYKHKTSAIRYARQQLKIKYDANLERVKL
jgi:hypothetical protein